jgi:cellobiose phosphorylase
MDAVYDQLVQHDAALVKLLAPPFDRSGQSPGYIQGYVPGIRENGGQYTHAAIWSVMAFAALGDTRRAWELMRMINPINHGRSDDRIATYKVEPYVMAADVYALPPHTGRGGWTWYTGSAGWTYRAIVESLLGVERSGDKLRFAPCIPAEWRQYKLRYRYGETTYFVTVSYSQAPTRNVAVRLDGDEQPDNGIPLVDDGVDHVVDVRCSGPSQPDLPPVS